MQVQDLAEKIIQSILDKHEGTCSEYTPTVYCIHTSRSKSVSDLESSILLLPRSSSDNLL